MPLSITNTVSQPWSPSSKSGVAGSDPKSAATPKAQHSPEVSRVSITWSSATESRSTTGVDAYRGVDATPEKTANPYATNILSFLEAGVKRAIADGASPDEARQKMQAGLEGFEKGFMQAWNELSASGILTSDIRTEIGETYHQVRAGMDQLADALGFERISMPDQLELEPEISVVDRNNGSPQPSTPVGPDELRDIARSVRSSIIEQLEQAREQHRADRDAVKTLEKNSYSRTMDTQNAGWMRYDAGQARDFSFELVTADGDRVTIKVSAMQVGTALGLSGKSGLDIAGRQSTAFQFEVDGELDSGELEAINNLLKGVADLSESFFSGGVTEAFEKALSLGFDTSEIRGFALNLSMSSVERVTQAYAPDQQSGASSIWPTLSGFVKPLTQAASMAESLGQNDAWLIEITRIVTERLYPDHPESAALQPLLTKML